MATAPRTPRGGEPVVKVAAGDVVLARYRVDEQIAAGGHSLVFRGTDERLSRPVCIKVFSGLGGNSGVGRTSYEHFVQEAFALSRLTHPNTLRIYDFGHLGGDEAEGLPLQVCEFMNGGTLSHLVRERGNQPIDETARVIGAMCAALGEAHALGIVHRDIKPQNILFGSVGQTRLPKLADFGIAKWSADEPEPKRAEDTAIVAGQKLAMYSPSWAAPEQLAGQPVSAATDIYSLAVVAIYMMSGRAIFADEDVYAGYRKRRQAADLVHDALTPLGVPTSAIGVLSRALAFDPRNRLATVEDLATGLAAAARPPEQHERRDAAREATEALVTPTIPEQAITPAAGTPQVEARPTAEATPPPAPVPAPAVAPIPAPAVAPDAPRWTPPVVRPPWMVIAPKPSGTARLLPMSDLPQPLSDRTACFVHAPTDVADLAGDQGRVRVTFLGAPGGGRVIHLKGMTCFVAHLGGRPSPAVTLGGAGSGDPGGDIALVTPRAQEIGHIRVSSGVAGQGHRVFAVGGDLVAIQGEDCSDPILFDFGPGSCAYFVYTRGRGIPKPRRR